jgi:putative ABC transport system substrate-binding protein
MARNLSAGGDQVTAFIGPPAYALFIHADGFYGSRRVQLATLVMRERMPASNVSREMVEAGLLMSYGTNIASMFRRVGIYTGSILKGATPADLPVIQSTKFEFVINARTAKVLGIELSPLLLTRARLNDGVDGPP